MMKDGLDVRSVPHGFLTFVDLRPPTWMLALCIVLLELPHSASPVYAYYGRLPSAASLQPTQNVGTESIIAAIERIRQGTHAEMPQPEQVRANGPVGDGITVENGTGTMLTVYFRGPTVEVVQVEPGASKGVALLVGNYEAAAELKDDSVIPHYGSLSLAPNTHYWLRFSVAAPAARPGNRPAAANNSALTGSTDASSLSVGRWSTTAVVRSQRLVSSSSVTCQMVDARARQ